VVKPSTRKKIKKIAIRSAKAAGILALLLAIAYFSFRNVILEKGLARISEKMRTDYDSHFSVKSASFAGISAVQMEDVFLAPYNKDTLFRVRQMRTEVSLLQLMFGQLQIEGLHVKNGYVNLVRNGKTSNYEAFLKKDADSLQSKAKERKNYAKTTYNLLTKVLKLVPTDMKLEDLSFSVNDNGKTAKVHFTSMHLDNKNLDSSIEVSTDTFRQRWRIQGQADPRRRKADLKVFSIDSGAIRVPYIEARYNLRSEFDSIRVKLTNLDMDGDELHVDGFASISNLLVNNPKIASKDVIIKKAQFDYNLLFGPDFIRVDSSSTAQLNQIKFHPFAEYNVEKDTVYKLKIDIPSMKAQHFINSLPGGLFTHFEGMVAEGSFGYQLNFMYNKNKPRALIFDSNLQKKDLKIIRYGEADLNKLNQQFVYRAIENGRPQRAVTVGSSNPNYTPLDQISPYLKHAVLTSEDPSFYRHKGFIAEAFKQSIISNLKTKKFTRGASTISMQLVKNVFLTREKTLSRKLEEILLVFVLENNRIASKSRMLEVYFNIIEWGPNVYGVGEAARFYFSKHPSELSLRESLFLASIIPSPKKFMWQFNREGNLKRGITYHQDRLTRLMFQRGLISTQDTLYQLKRLLISGPARSYIKTDPVEEIIVPDTLMSEFDF
jgi:hypothetical protein